MKLKHLFFSSLLLSTTFVACTNDDIVENLPVDNEGAIALGEGYTINVAKGLESRAAFNESSFSPLWEEGDKIGAAWFDEVTALNPNDETKVSTSKSFGDKFRSNHPFELIDGEGSGRGTFESVTNAFAGAYMLYYPYTSAISKTGDRIYVNEIPQTQTMDCTPGHEWDAVNENMFAYGTAKFVPGGPTAQEFNMDQVPVLYHLYFQFAKPRFLELVDGVAIEKIVLEAYKGSNKVLRTTGYITPPNVEVTPTGYNTDILPSAKYTGETETQHLTINLLNSDADDYKLFTLNTPNEKPFIFSALPFAEKADKVIFKVVASNGYVFTKTYEGTEGAAALAYINGDVDLDEDGELDKDGAAYQGGYVNFTVTLDTQVDDNVAYTNEQFMEKWEEALESKKDTEILYGEDLELDEVLTFNNESDAVITVKAHCDNHSLTINGLNVENGNVVFASPLIVEGDVISEAEGNLTADNITAENITANGYATFVVASADLLKVAASGEVTLSQIADKPGVADILINNAGAAYGKLTAKNMWINDMTNNGIVVVESGVKIARTGTVENNHSFQVKKSLENNGTFNQNSTLQTTEAFINNAGAELNIAKETSGCMIINKPIDNINALPAGEINVGLSETNKKLVLTSGSKNEGTINLVKGTLELKTSFNYQYAGDINVGEDAKINFKAQSNMQGGRVIVIKENAYTNINSSNVYYRIDEDEDIEVVPAYSNVKNLIFNGTINMVKGLRYYSWTLENATLKISEDIAMTNSSTIKVTGNSIIMSSDTTEKQLALCNGTTNSIENGAVLTLNRINLVNTGTAKLTSKGSINALNGSKFNVNSGI